eukprot:CAMPEP_0182440008 /NCGR_PEP_ID=MMETSP1167-20130531/86787_1 /TAXON_ID=2988 /ORGANISM="Mallomonas Sp, Strain CCMP3275" /LENGTH=227 /DNA_ID=CAMNT_0024633839 /DNA_START=732 /DNA_END=1412 /DNA_ORIENTATION=+
MRTVTALNAQPDIISRYRIFLIDAMEVGIIKSFKLGLGNGSMFCAVFLTYALGFWYGAELVADGVENDCSDCITGGMMLTTFFCVVIGAMNIGQMVPPITAFTAAAAAVSSMNHVTKRTPAIDGFSSEGSEPNSRPSGRIELKDVVFAYPSRPDVNVCDYYSLKVRAGDTVALCGASGAGKSTIVNLLLRFYDPQAGHITLDDVNIKDLNIRWLRSQIGYVGQEPVL